MKIDVGQQRRGTAALGRPFFHSYSFPILQHAGVQPFLDEPHDAPVRYPVLDELHQPFVGKPSKKPRMSRSSTQFTFLVSSPVYSASSALCWLRPGRNPYEKPRKSVS